MAKFAFTLIIIFYASIAWAQPGPPDDPDVPITGIEILVALGAFFGVRKVWNSRKRS